MGAEEELPYTWWIDFLSRGRRGNWSWLEGWVCGQAQARRGETGFAGSIEGGNPKWENDEDEGYVRWEGRFAERDR